MCVSKICNLFGVGGSSVFFYALLLTFSVLFIVPTQIYKERVDASKLMKSNLKVVKGMMNKTELDYAAMGILF